MRGRDLVSTERSQALIDAVLVREDRMLVAAAVRDPSKEGSPGPDRPGDHGELAPALRQLRELRYAGLDRTAPGRSRAGNRAWARTAGGETPGARRTRGADPRPAGANPAGAHPASVNPAVVSKRIL